MYESPSLVILSERLYIKKLVKIVLLKGLANNFYEWRWLFPKTTVTRNCQSLRKGCSLKCQKTDKMWFITCSFKKKFNLSTNFLNFTLV